MVTSSILKQISTWQQSFELAFLVAFITLKFTCALFYDIDTCRYQYREKHIKQLNCNMQNALRRYNRINV